MCWVTVRAAASMNDKTCRSASVYPEGSPPEVRNIFRVSDECFGSPRMLQRSDATFRLPALYGPSSLASNSRPGRVFNTGDEAMAFLKMVREAAQRARAKGT